MKFQVQSFDLLLDGVPYLVTARPYDFNGDTRFLVNYNGGAEEYVFTRDSSLGRFTAIGDNASTIPDNLEQAVAEKLRSLT